jgi:pilus assembly protein Flp/PilA
MKHFKMLVQNYAGDESGATAIEYGLIAALIGMGLIGGASALSGSTNSAWNNMTDKVQAEF